MPHKMLKQRNRGHIVQFIDSFRLMQFLNSQAPKRLPLKWLQVPANQPLASQPGDNGSNYMHNLSNMGKNRPSGK
jgi:hypothetical protein